jgi:hypothetical protein
VFQKWFLGEPGFQYVPLAQVAVIPSVAELGGSLNEMKLLTSLPLAPIAQSLAK